MFWGPDPPVLLGQGPHRSHRQPARDPGWAWASLQHPPGRRGGQEEVPRVGPLRMVLGCRGSSEEEEPSGGGRGEAVEVGAGSGACVVSTFEARGGPDPPTALRAAWNTEAPPSAWGILTRRLGGRTFRDPPPPAGDLAGGSDHRAEAGGRGRRLRPQPRCAFPIASPHPSANFWQTSRLPRASPLLPTRLVSGARPSRS